MQHVFAQYNVLQEEELAVADTRETRLEAAGRAARRLGLDGLFVHLPVFAVGRIGQQVVKVLPAVAVVGQDAAEGDVVGVPAVAGQVEIGLGHGIGLGVDLLAEQVDLRARVELVDALLGDGQHAARAAARVVDRLRDTRQAQRGPILQQQQVDHEADDLARREVLAGVLVERLVEAADKLLEDVAHLQIRDLVGVQIDVLESLHHLEQEAGVVEPGDGVVEVELVQHVAHVGAEAVDVVAQVGRQVRRVAEQALEVIERGVVEGVAGGPAQHRVEVIQLILVQRVGFEHLALRGLEHAVEAAQHRERQDDVLILAALERVANEIRDAP